MDLRDRQAAWKRRVQGFIHIQSFTVVLFSSSHNLKLCTNWSTFPRTNSSWILNAPKSSALLADKRLWKRRAILRVCLFLRKSLLPRLRTSCGSVLWQVFFPNLFYPGPFGTFLRFGQIPEHFERDAFLFLWCTDKHRPLLFSSLFPPFLLFRQIRTSNVGLLPVKWNWRRRGSVMASTHFPFSKCGDEMKHAKKITFVFAVTMLFTEPTVESRQKSTFWAVLGRGSSPGGRLKCCSRFRWEITRRTEIHSGRVGTLWLISDTHTENNMYSHLQMTSQHPLLTCRISGKNLRGKSSKRRTFFFFLWKHKWYKQCVVLWRNLLWSKIR